MILSDASIRHRTTVFVLMAIIVAMGISAYFSMPRESEPDIEIPIMNVITIYPGVAPGDVETLLTIPIENELKNLRDVEKVTSVSAEGASIITIEFQPSVDLDFALQKVKEKVDAAEPDLPADAEDPMVQEISISEFPIMQVNVTVSGSPGSTSSHVSTWVRNTSPSNFDGRFPIGGAGGTAWFESTIEHCVISPPVRTQ